MTIVSRVRRIWETATGQNAEAETVRQELRVQQLPGGIRQYNHPMVPSWTERRRARISASGGDELDRILAAIGEPSGYMGRPIHFVNPSARVGGAR